MSASRTPTVASAALPSPDRHGSVLVDHSGIDHHRESDPRARLPAPATLRRWRAQCQDFQSSRDPSSCLLLSPSNRRHSPHATECRREEKAWGRLLSRVHRASANIDVSHLGRTRHRQPCSHRASGAHAATAATTGAAMMAEHGPVPSGPRSGRTATAGAAACYSTFMTVILVQHPL